LELHLLENVPSRSSTPAGLIDEEQVARSFYHARLLEDVGFYDHSLRELEVAKITLERETGTRILPSDDIQAIESNEGEEIYNHDYNIDQENLQRILDYTREICEAAEPSLLSSEAQMQTVLSMQTFPTTSLLLPLVPLVTEKMIVTAKSRIHRKRGQSLFSSQNYKSAIEEFDLAIDSDDSNGEAFLFKGYALMALEHYDAAIELLERAEQLYSQKDHGKHIVDEKEDFSLMMPGTPGFYSTVARVYKEVGNYKKAAEKYIAAAELFPESPELHYRAGNAFLELQAYDNAVQMYSKVLELDVDSNSRWRRKAVLNKLIAEVRTLEGTRRVEEASN